MNGEKFYIALGKPNTTKPRNMGEVKRDTMNCYNEYTLEEIANQVGNYGCSIIPAELVGGMSKQNFRSMQIFMLDFDGKSVNNNGREKGTDISFMEIKKRAENYGLRIGFAYKTFSCQEGSLFYKFRIAFIHEFEIKDNSVVTLIFNELKKMFPECDSACCEPSRIFLGGKECIWYDEEARFNVVQLTQQIYSCLNQNQLNRDIHSLVKNTDISLINNRIAIGYLNTISIFGENKTSPIITLIGESVISTIFYLSREKIGKHHCQTSKKHQVYNVNLDNIKGVCKLLDEFLERIKLDHMQRFMILTNLRYVRNGIKLFMEGMEIYGQDIKEKWMHDINYIKDYLPMSCSREVCPYYDECMKSSFKKNILLRLRYDKRIFIEQEAQYGTFEEATNQFVQSFDAAYKSVGSGIHIIKAQTAFGKTTQIIAFVEEHPDLKILVAEPTNIMKHQLYKDLGRCDSVAETKSAIDSVFLNGDNEEIVKRYTSLHNAGKHKLAKKVIQDYYNKVCEDRPYALAEIEEIAEILGGISICLDKRVVVSTHAMLAYTSEDILKIFDFILIDEDILYLQFLNNTKKVSKLSIEWLSQSNNSSWKFIAKQMLKAQENQYYKAGWSNNPLPSIDDEEIEGDETVNIFSNSYDQVEDNGNYYDLCNAGSYILINGVYHYLCITKLPKLKYIVLTATANIEVYKKYFDNTKVIEYPQISVKYEGKLEQFVYHSLGRRDLQSKRCVADFIKDYTGNDDITKISFKLEETLNDTKIHFGNAIGVNDFSGKDIAIIGTPYKNPLSYLLPCTYLYGEETVKNYAMSQRRVSYGGYSFLITTFQKEKLINFQMYSLESELEQAIGRARLLRKKCTVYLFSSFPCKQANLHMSDYLEKYTIDKKMDQLQADPFFEDIKG